MKYFVLFAIAGFFMVSSANAQYYRMMPPPRRYRQAPRQRQDSFKPELYLSLGYGYPNLDVNALPIGIDHFYNGNPSSQTGPIWGSLDYRFNRSTSIGVTVAYGKVTTPYYNVRNSSAEPPSFSGKLEDWSVMLNLVRYIPAGKIVTPYLRTAIGVNLWNQSFPDSTGRDQYPGMPKPDMLAYQASLGVKFNIDKGTGLFIEAGYGKYILGAGLSFKF